MNPNTAKPVRLEVVEGQVCAFNDIGAFCDCGSLPDFFRKHEAGELRIVNINRPDLAECYSVWKGTRRAA